MFSGIFDMFVLWDVRTTRIATLQLVLLTKLTNQD